MGQSGDQLLEWAKARLLQASQTAGGTTPTRIRMSKTRQPMQNAKTDSRVAAVPRIATSTNPTSWRPATSQSTVAATLTSAPTP